MAAKKMFPRGEIDRILNTTYDEVKLQIDVRIRAKQINFQITLNTSG